MCLQAYLLRRNASVAVIPSALPSSTYLSVSVEESQLELFQSYGRAYIVSTVVLSA